MTDRELLAEVASLAKLPYSWWRGSLHWPLVGFFMLDSSGTPAYAGRAWNPLFNRDEAWDLAERFNLQITFGPTHALASDPKTGKVRAVHVDKGQGARGKTDATCRAIVELISTWGLTP